MMSLFMGATATAIAMAMGQEDWGNGGDQSNNGNQSISNCNGAGATAMGQRQWGKGD
jgi:hypothetical protein